MKQDSIWDHFQNEDVNVFSGDVGRLKFLINKTLPGEVVLNIGVGAGTFEQLAIEKGVKLHCLDPSSRSIETIRKKYNLGDKAQIGYSQCLPFQDDYFDVVVMSEVLEHLNDETLNQTLCEVNRVLKQQGKFLGTVPASEDLSESMVVCPDCDKKFHRWGHVQSFDSDSLVSLLQNEFQKILVENRLFISWGALNWKGKISESIKLILAKSGVHGENENLYFEARKS